MAKIGRGLRRYEEEHIPDNKGYELRWYRAKTSLLGRLFILKEEKIKWVSMKNWNGGG